MTHSSGSLLIQDVNPAEFFRDYVQEAQKRQHIVLSEHLEFYLVNLLCDFLNAENLSDNNCLALLLAKARESSLEERLYLLKTLGDTSLYFSGFFQESYTSKGFDISYCISMGQNAFDELASALRKRSKKDAKLASTYRELARKFKQAVNILLDVSEQTGQTHHISRSTLSLYDAWLDTSSEQLEKELLERGILPIAVNKKIVV